MAAKNQGPESQFKDFLPLMAEKLGGEGLIEELCNAFNLLMDRNKGVITFESLKRNSSLLGLLDLDDEDLQCMLSEGDYDGDVQQRMQCSSGSIPNSSTTMSQQGENSSKTNIASSTSIAPLSALPRPAFSQLEARNPQTTILDLGSSLPLL